MIKDRPGFVAFLIILLVGTHASLSLLWPVLDLGKSFVRTGAAISEVYVGFAAVSAVAAGFAGVMVVFATLTGGIWSRVRNLGDASLARNWIGPMQTTFAAAFLAAGAAVLAESTLDGWAWWPFEAAVLLTLEAVSRIGWLLSGLLIVQRNIDRAAALKARQPNLKDLGLGCAQPDDSASDGDSKDED